jgi:hypothetical protein
MTELDETIQLALEAYAENVRKSGMSVEVQSFTIRQVFRAANELLSIARTIRDTMALRKTKDWRAVCGIHDELMTQGQRFSSLLWNVNLRDKVTDVIEEHYGLSFSGLRIYRHVLDKADNRPAFVSYDPTVFPTTVPRHGGGYTILKDGQRVFVPVNEFLAKYDNA